MLDVMAMVRLRVLLPAAAVAAGLVLGCGGSDGGSSARATATATATQAPAEADGHAGSGERRRSARACGSCGSAASTRPVFVTAPPGDRRVQFVVEQGGRIMVVRDGRKLRRAVPGHLLAGRPPAASRACCRWRSRPTTPPAGASTSTSPTATATSASSSTGARAPTAPTPARARLVLRDGRQRVQPQRRAAAVRPRRPPLHRHGRRRRRRRPARVARQRAEPRLAARQDPADRPAAGRRPRRTRCRARTRSSGAPARAARSTATACATRGASRSTAARGDLSIGDVGQGEVEEIDFVRSGRGKNFGWRPFEGRSRYTAGESAPGHVRPVIQRFHSRGQLLDHGRRRRPRPRGARALRPLRVRRLLPGPDRVGPAAPGPRERRSAPRGCASRSLSSFGEDARGRVYATSLDGPVYRIAARR